jgi:hypothetical protein
MALALFVIGPQSGSLDYDGDGSPDIPIVVSVSIPSLGDVLSTKRLLERSTPAAGVIVDVVADLRTAQFDVGKSNFSSLAGRSVLRTSCLLRC